MTHVITRSIFSKILTTDSHSVHNRAKYGTALKVTFPSLWIYDSNNPVRSHICICHDSWAVVTGAKLWSDVVIIFQIRALNFCKISLMSLQTIDKQVLDNQHPLGSTSTTHWSDTFSSGSDPNESDHSLLIPGIITDLHEQYSGLTQANMHLICVWI